MLMGPPGAGKGTQAFRLAEKFPNFAHFDTGAEIYRRVTDPHFADDPLVQEQKGIYFGGKLNTPEWVAGLVAERIRFYSGKGQGVIFSGSPRTLYEGEAILPLLQECYGRRILMAELVVPPETAGERSTHRITCANKACRYPAHAEQGGTPCPNCGQTLPNPQEGTEGDESWKIIKLGTRFIEFVERTRPVIEFLKEKIAYARIDGEKDEDEVFAQIIATVEKNLIQAST